MLEKNNNLVATAISETFNNSDNNYLLGDWCRKVSDFSKNQYSIKFILPTLKKIFSLDKVYFLNKLDLKSIKKLTEEMKPGELCLVENIRFQKEEEKINLHFAKNISNLFDVYVNDAFSASHRNHTSIIGFPKFEIKSTKG